MLTKENLPLLFKERFIQTLKSETLASLILIDEAPLYQAAYRVIEQLKKAHLSSLKKDQGAYKSQLLLIDTFKETLDIKRHITPLIQKHAPHLVMPNLETDFNNETLKEKIHSYRRNKKDSIQDGLFHFLSAMVTMYRTELNHQPLKVFLEAISNDLYLHKRLKARLRDDAQKEVGEHWATGNHEWLPCHLIKPILERSAGMHAGYQAFVIQEKDNNIDIIDWLSLHRTFRTPVKRIYFLNSKRTLISGHVPAIRDRLEGHPNEGSQVFGTKAYHAALEEAFNTHRTLNDFIRQCPYIEKDHLIRGKKPIAPSACIFFTVEGHKTNEKVSLSILRREKIRPAHRDRKTLMLALEKKTKKKGVLPRVPSLTSTITQLSDPLLDSLPPIKDKIITPIKPMPKKDSLSSLGSTVSYDIEEPYHDEAVDETPRIKRTFPTNYLDIVESVLFETLKQCQMQREIRVKINTLFTQLRVAKPDHQNALYDELNKQLSPHIKLEYMINLSRLYSTKALKLDKDRALLTLTSNMSYRDIIMMWFLVREKPPKSIQNALSKYILKHTIFSTELNQCLLRENIQSELLLPFFLTHEKVGDGREGNPHKRKYNQLKTTLDIKRLIEASRNISHLYDDTFQPNVIGDYYDLKSAYTALYRAISSPSTRYTRKKGLFSYCCPGLFNDHGPRAHLSQLAQRHLKLLKRAFMENVHDLLRTTQKQNHSSIINAIKTDLDLEDHFMNESTDREMPICCPSHSRRNTQRRFEMIEQSFIRP